MTPINDETLSELRSICKCTKNELEVVLMCLADHATRYVKLTLKQSGQTVRVKSSQLRSRGQVQLPLETLVTVWNLVGNRTFESPLDETFDDHEESTRTESKSDFDFHSTICNDFAKAPELKWMKMIKRTFLI